MIPLGRLAVRGRGLSALRSLSSTASVPEKPLAVLCILDGWGYRETPKDNAVIQADTPTFDSLYGIHSQRGQVAFLDACEREVGLPDGQIGNSEVGHMNIGAGRIVWQDLCTIDNAIADGTLADRPALVEHIAKLKASGGYVARGGRVDGWMGVCVCVCVCVRACVCVCVCVAWMHEPLTIHTLPAHAIALPTYHIVVPDSPLFAPPPPPCPSSQDVPPHGLRLTGRGARHAGAHRRDGQRRRLPRCPRRRPCLYGRPRRPTKGCQDDDA